MLILAAAEFGNSAEQELKKEHLFMVDFWRFLSYNAVFFSRFSAIFLEISQVFCIFALVKY